MQQSELQKKNNNADRGGFALLLTLIVVSVVVALGLSLVEISLRQLNLSGVSRDSEVAFHAAYMGSECAEYSVREARKSALNAFAGDEGSGAMENDCVDGGSINFIYNEPQTDVHVNTYNITWPSGEQCTKVSIYVMDAVSAGADLTYDFGGSLGYKNKSCVDGRICTLIFSQGFNRSCADVDAGVQRIIQREVVSEF